MALFYIVDATDAYFVANICLKTKIKDDHLI